MLSLFRSLSLRYLLQRWDRALLIITSIALGVATLVSTRILNNCIEAVVQQSTNPVALGQVQIKNGELGFPIDLAKEIESAQVPGVKSLLPLVYDRIGIVEGNDLRAAYLFGTDLSFLQPQSKEKKDEVDVRDALKVEIVLDPGKLSLLSKLVTKKWVLVSEDIFLEREKTGSGWASMKIRFANFEQEMSVIGYLRFAKDSPVLNFARNLVASDFEIASRLLRAPIPNGQQLLHSSLVQGLQEFQPVKINGLEVFLQDGANPEEVMDRLTKLVGNRGRVRTPEQQKKATEDVVGGIQISFSLCAVGAIIVGLFLVYNSLSVSVAERRHDIGILRSLGATRWQIASLFTSEAMFMGIVGGVIGIPVGKVLSDWAIGLFRTEIVSVALGGDSLPTRLTIGIAAFAVACGILTALFASLIPALQAASDQPADAVRRAPSPVAGLLRILHLLGCILMVFTGAGMVAFRESLPDRTGAYVGLVLTLTGLFLAMPFFVRILARLFQPVFRWFFGIEGRLAADNLIRAPGRTGIVIGALAGGISLIFQTSGVGRSNEEPVVEWIDQVLKADAYVFFGNIVSATSSSTPMLAYIGKEIKNEVPGVEEVVRQRYYRPEFNDTVVYLQAMDALAYRRMLLQRTEKGKEPRGLDSFLKLPTGPYCVVSDNFLIRHQRKIGDIIEVPSPRGPVKLEILETVRDYSWSKGTTILDIDQYTKLFDDDYVDLFHVFFKQDISPEEGLANLRKKMDEYRLLVESQAAIKGELRKEIDKIYKLAYIQQFLVGVVATLGVIMALLISVLQRQRELGLLRAVGATRFQVLRSVLAEAMMMGVLGTFLGILLGIPLEWYLLRVVLFEETGFYFEVLLPWVQTIVISIVAITIATLAGLLPAIHAVRLKIAEAIHYE